MSSSLQTPGAADSSSEESASSPLKLPCSTPNLQPADVWQAVLDAASERASIHTMVSALTLVSINPDRAVIGHAQRDRLTAEMALGHLVVLFERTLGKRIAVSLMQLKDDPRASAPPSRTPVEAQPLASSPRPAAQATTPAQRQPQSPALAPPPPPPPPRPAAPVDIEAAKANPLVLRAAELLNAKVVRITARSDTPSTPPAP